MGGGAKAGQTFICGGGGGGGARGRHRNEGVTIKSQILGGGGGHGVREALHSYTTG